MYDSKGLLFKGRENLDKNKQVFAVHQKELSFEESFLDEDVF